MRPLGELTKEIPRFAKKKVYINNKIIRLDYKNIFETIIGYG